MISYDVGCDPGRFGEMCEFECHCKNEEPCSRLGSCPSGCHPGWVNTTCQTRKLLSDFSLAIGLMSFIRIFHLDKNIIGTCEGFQSYSYIPHFIEHAIFYTANSNMSYYHHFLNMF